MKNADQPIHPCLMQQVGSSEWRPAKPGDPKEHSRMLPGMTKREYFAVMAMQGILSNEGFIRRGITGISSGDIKTSLEKHVAEMARELADALLAELESSSPSTQP